MFIFNFILVSVLWFCGSFMLVILHKSSKCTCDKRIENVVSFMLGLVAAMFVFPTFCLRTS